MPKTPKWKKQDKAVRAAQVAFELEKKTAQSINKMAVAEGLTASSQIRKLIGLSYSPPKRPRLTVSLSDQDYVILGEKYGVDPEDTLEIKRKIMAELIQLVEKR